jgi:hypothetical protein
VCPRRQSGARCLDGRDRRQSALPSCQEQSGQAAHLCELLLSGRQLGSTAQGSGATGVFSGLLWLHILLGLARLDNRGATRNMIDVHRRKAALIVMRVPERKLLAAMRRAEGVIDVEDLKLARPHGGAELVNESCTQPRRLGLARCILKAADGRLRGPDFEQMIAEVKAGARATDWHVEFFEVRSGEDINAVFASQELARLGWVEGRNVRIDRRWANNDADLALIFAKELVGLRPDVILANGDRATAALQRETRTIPIVFAGARDPVGEGLVADLPRPGGNITGFGNQAEPGIVGKLVQMLKEIATGIRRVAIMYHPDMLPFQAR